MAESVSSTETSASPHIPVENPTQPPSWGPSTGAVANTVNTSS